MEEKTAGDTQTLEIVEELSPGKTAVTFNDELFNSLEGEALTRVLRREIRKRAGLSLIGLVPAEVP